MFDRAGLMSYELVELVKKTGYSAYDITAYYQQLLDETDGAITWAEFKDRLLGDEVLVAKYKRKKIRSHYDVIN